MRIACLEYASEERVDININDGWNYVMYILFYPKNNGFVILSGSKSSHQAAEIFIEFEQVLISNR